MFRGPRDVSRCFCHSRHFPLLLGALHLLAFWLQVPCFLAQHTPSESGRWRLSERACQGHAHSCRISGCSCQILAIVAIHESKFNFRNGTSLALSSCPSMYEFLLTLLAVPAGPSPAAEADALPALPVAGAVRHLALLLPNL